MGPETQPLFIVSSGRSGTHMLTKLLEPCQQIEIHHEYLCTHVQPLAVKYYLGLLDFDEVYQELQQLYGNAVYYSKAPLWVDSSNKVSWLIDVLVSIFPNARFVHLIRDGRKVVSSYYHKLSDECYDDRSIEILQAYVDDPQKHALPPPEKRYWWHLPKQGTNLAEAFRHYDRFQRICFHWGEVHRVILDKLSRVNKHQVFTCKLEELTADKNLLCGLMAFIGVDNPPELYEKIQRPVNVIVPDDYPLTPAQYGQLMQISGDMMEHFGYTHSEEYRVKYHT